MTPLKDFIKHPILTARKLRIEQKEKTPEPFSAARRDFLKFGTTCVTGLGAIALLSKCALDIAGPSCV